MSDTAEAKSSRYRGDERRDQWERNLPYYFAHAAGMDEFLRPSNHGAPPNMPILNTDEFKRAIQSMVALGATAKILVRASELARDPNTDLVTIGDLIKNDGPLVADIIRISNSAYYSAPTPHGNLNSAMNYIGLREVVRVVNLSLARLLFARDLVSYGMSAREYWSISLATALVMEVLAKRSNFSRDDAYTIGIIHAIGRVLINRIIQDNGYALRRNGRQPLEEWERSAVGVDFAETGALMAEMWSFPLPTCEVIRWQLDPSKVEVPVSLLGALQFAGRLLTFTGPDFTKRGWQMPEDDPYLQAAGLTPTHVDHIVSECEDGYQRVLQTVDL